MIDKTVKTIEAAVAGIKNGATIMVSGFGEAGAPSLLMEAIINQGANNLTAISNNAGEAYHGFAKLIAEKRVDKVICSFPTAAKKAVVKDFHLSLEETSTSLLIPEFESISPDCRPSIKAETSSEDNLRDVLDIIINNLNYCNMKAVK